ncbi:cornulin-like [Grus americana]|uniref:cornulin-like n=1 Tax=Grus americana TaxID=9117 RepID=UPI00240890F6|nr:cornulin-like [Grus americana]
MAQLQENTNDILSAFYMCARSNGNCSPLSKEELRQLIEQEFRDAMENAQDPKTIKKVLCFLDDDSNCRVDFSELLSLVFCVAKACYKPLQQHQEQEDGEKPTAQEKAGKEQPLGSHTVGRVSCNLQIPKQGVNNQVQDTKTQDQDTRQTQEGETPKENQDTCQTQEGEAPKEDQDTRQTQEGEAPKEDQDTRQTQEGEAPKEDQDTRQNQESETPEQDQDVYQDDRTEAAEGDSERGDILDTATPEQDRNTHKAEDPETPKQDPKTHWAKETEAPGKGSKHHQRPETESAEQDLNCPSDTRGRDPKNKTQVCNAPQRDPNHSKTQKLLPPQQGASPRWDPKPWGTHHDPAFHQLPESKVVEQEHNKVEPSSCPAQQQQDAHRQRQPAIEQQLLQPLYPWPLQQ